MTLSLFTNWATGVLNGYSLKDNGLPKGIIYGTLGVTTFANMVKVLGSFNAPEIKYHTAGNKLASVFIGVPIIMGTTFCIGNFFGKGIRHVKDIPSDPNNKSPLINLV